MLPEVTSLGASSGVHMPDLMGSSSSLPLSSVLPTRKLVERAKTASLPADVAPDFYVCSLSTRTIVYKGMLRSVVVGQFYEDLVNPDYETAFAIYHRRFSTNTTPKWPLAQPMRLLGHNGEINTLQVWVGELFTEAVL